MAGTELAKAYVQIIPSADGIKGKISSALGGEASSAGNSAGKTAGINLGASIKKVIAAAGIGAALKSAITEGANLQQSLGGIETLFGDSAAKVIANAQIAYRTAGLSANDYMETVTGFSASLLQGLAGDTNKAADVADMALTDMADNANKMGTSMESIQNAYQGFAKQNYTMLDNLKLGYGGTKAEMERLLATAGKVAGVKYDINNLSDVYEAIHVIQEKVMGITGTTAEEAATTLSGSLASMKSALSNVLGNLALGEDIKSSMDALIKSVGTFLLDNLFPMVGKILTGLIKYIIDAAVNTDWVSVITEVLTAIRDALNNTISTCFGADTTLVNDIFGFLIDGVPMVVQIVQDAFGVLWDVCKAVWDSVGQPIWDAIAVTMQYLSDNWSSISESIKTGFQTVWDICSTIWTTIGQPVWDMISFAVGSLANMFAEHMPAITAFFQGAIAGMQDTWENHLKPVFEAIGDVLNNYIKPAFEFVWATIIEPLIENVFRIIADLWNNTLKPVFDGICDYLTGVFTGDWEKMGDGILSILTGLWNGVCSIFEGIWNFICDVFNNIKDYIKDIIPSIKDFMIGKFQDAKDNVISIFTSIKEGIEEKIQSAKDTVKNVIETIKGFFKFEWSLPKLKMPHVSINGSFSLSPLSVPTFGIDWYAKAMNDPMIMNSPTAFGINSLGQIMAGGEKGSEVVSGTDTLMNMIAAAVSSQNNALLAVLIRILEAITNMDENMAFNLREALEGIGITLNEREFARLVKAVK